MTLFEMVPIPLGEDAQGLCHLVKDDGTTLCGTEILAVVADEATEDNMTCPMCSLEVV